MDKMFNFMQLLFGKKLSSEAFEAYFHRIPESITVRWFRDGNFIIGVVKTKDKEFTTQGRNPDEFIEMVNDSILTVYGIPKDYIDVVRKFKTFIPPEQEMARLENQSISKSTFGSRKNQKVLQLA